MNRGYKMNRFTLERRSWMLNNSINNTELELLEKNRGLTLEADWDLLTPQQTKLLLQIANQIEDEAEDDDYYY